MGISLPGGKRDEGSQEKTLQVAMVKWGLIREANYKAIRPNDRVNSGSQGFAGTRSEGVDGLHINALQGCDNNADASPPSRDTTASIDTVV